MFKSSTINCRRGLLVLILTVAMILTTAPLVLADGEDGHIGGKPDIGQGDGIPQDKPGTIRAGEQNQDGDANQGGDPAQDGGDGIPNGGPIEGEEHGNKDGSCLDPINNFFQWLFLHQYDG